MYNIIRIIWRTYRKLFYNLMPLFFYLLFVVFFPLLFLYALFCRKKGRGYFCGVHDIANNLFYLNTFFEGSGKKHQLYLVPQKYLNEESIRLKIKMYFFLFLIFIKNIRENQVFIFNWHITFFPFNLDLILFKIARKSVLIIHCGDDVRFRPIHNKLIEQSGMNYLFPENKSDTPYLGFLRKLWRQKWPLLCNSKVLSCRETETFLDKKGCYQAFLFQPSSRNSFNKNIVNPLIVHAPSSRAVKGTEIVLEAINILKKKKVFFQFELLEKIDNSIVMSKLSQALIVIDQPGYACGRLAAESLANRCIVLNNEDPCMTGFDRELPLKPFPDNAKDLAEVIEKIITSAPEKLHEDMQKSYNAWYEHYSYESVEKKINYLLSETSQPNLFPHTDYKKKLLQAAENSFQRFMIKLFIK